MEPSWEEVANSFLNKEEPNREEEVPTKETQRAEQGATPKQHKPKKTAVEGITIIRNLAEGIPTLQGQGIKYIADKVLEALETGDEEERDKQEEQKGSSKKPGKKVKKK